ncbi:MAG TPA: class I SAM-dependent methyltransferase [Deltaproteobacteria bacterium]|nr:class I SAM-dependent methyltransferase [Deltaproteobacteria bacterium]
MTSLVLSDIEDACRKISIELIKETGLAYRKTEKGLWATSILRDVYEAFKWACLEKYKHFVDLGSGDGRVVALASLFTRASGIEIDPVLHMASEKLKDFLELENVQFHLGDFEKWDLNEFDFIYMYPDRAVIRIGNQLEDTWEGTIMIAGSHFEPSNLIKVAQVKFSIERFVLYKKS